MKIKFTKMHGIGNDYVYVNCFSQPMPESDEDTGRISKQISDRHFGIGSDGLILIRPSEKADFEMAMYNADGSRSEMCGNGIRCVAKYVYDHKLTNKTTVTVETLGGIKTLKLFPEEGQVKKVTVDMGVPVLEAQNIPVICDTEKAIKEPICVNGNDLFMTCVSMGNPHAVFFTEDVSEIDLKSIGPFFENHERFPKRINTEFVRVCDRQNISMRVWERGSGETLACGTGACACVVACVLNDLTQNEVRVHLLGGDLDINWDKDDHVYMTGEATEVFSGEIEI